MATGEQLSAPSGHERDELGSLVADVNSLVNSFVEILGRERQERQERERGERQLRNILNNVQNGVFQLDRDGLLLSCNPAFLTLFELSPESARELPKPIDEVLGRDGEAIIHTLNSAMLTFSSNF